MQQWRGPSAYYVYHIDFRLRYEEVDPGGASHMRAHSGAALEVPGEKMMNALELTAFGLFGIVLSLAVTGLNAQKPYMSVAGGMGIPVEDVLLQPSESRLASVRTAATGAVEVTVSPRHN